MPCLFRTLCTRKTRLDRQRSRSGRLRPAPGRAPAPPLAFASFVLRVLRRFRAFAVKTPRPMWLSLAALLLLAGCSGAPVLVTPGAPPASASPAASAPAPAATAQPALAPSVGYTATVQASNASQSKPLTGGVTITSTEDVTTPRTHYGGTFTDVATSDAVSFQPYLVTDEESFAYQGMVYTAGLLRVDENTLDEIPNMAQSYAISPDGLTFTFHLRHNMLWSDGQPITAQDFKWTYDQVVNPAHAFPYLDQLDFISSYVALDDYTLQVKIKQVYAPALEQISDLITPLPKHVWQNLDWSDPQKNPQIMAPTVVSGPYKLVQWKRDQYATFEANPDYWYHGAPNITHYTIEIVPSEDVGYQMLKTGQSDSGTITPDNLADAKKLPNINVYEWWPAAATWSYIGLNERSGFATSDINVRHGLSYALDKVTMTNQIMLGQAKPMCSIFPDTSWAYNPNVACYPYSTQQALAEFAKSGYTEQGGKLVDKSGKQLELRLVYGPNSDKTRELLAVTVQDYLSKIGIKTDIQALEWNSFLQAIQSNNPNWDLFLGAWQSTIEPQLMYTIWSQQNIPQLNSVAYVNKQVEDLFTQAGATYDTAVRKQKYGQIQQIIAGDEPYIFLFYEEAWAGLNKRILGIKPTALGIDWNQEDWYIAGN